MNRKKKNPTFPRIALIFVFQISGINLSESSRSMQAPSSVDAYITQGGVLVKIFSYFAMVPGKSIHFMSRMNAKGQANSSQMACWLVGCVGWNVKDKQMVYPHTQIIFTWLYISSNPWEVITLVLIWLAHRWCRLNWKKVFWSQLWLSSAYSLSKPVSTDDSHTSILDS